MTEYRMMMPKQIKKDGSLVVLKKGAIVTESDFPIAAQFKDFITKGVLKEVKEQKPEKALKSAEKDSKKDEAKATALARKAALIADENKADASDEGEKVEADAENAEAEVDGALDSIVEGEIDESNEPEEDVTKYETSTPPDKSEAGLKTKSDPEAGTTGMVALDDETMTLANASDEEYKNADSKTKRQITMAKKKLSTITGE